MLRAGLDKAHSGLEPCDLQCSIVFRWHYQCLVQGTDDGPNGSTPYKSYVNSIQFFPGTKITAMPVNQPGMASPTHFQESLAVSDNKIPKAAISFAGAKVFILPHHHIFSHSAEKEQLFTASFSSLLT